MKTIVFLIFFGLIGVGFSFSTSTHLYGNGDIITVERSVPAEFNGIILYTNLPLHIYQSKDIKLSITVDSNLEEYIQTNIEDGILKIRQPNNTFLQTTNSVIRVCMPNINYIRMYGNGDVVLVDKITSELLTLERLGVGNITGFVDCKNFTADIDGYGNITIKGKSQYAKLIISGSGDFNCAEFEVIDAKIVIDGAGDVTINVSNTLEARITGAGDIRYIGSPKITLRETGSGTVKALEN